MSINTYINRYKFFYTGFSVKGKMPNGEWRTFATEQEYMEAFNEELKENGVA